MFKFSMKEIQKSLKDQNQKFWRKLQITRYKTGDSYSEVIFLFISKLFRSKTPSESLKEHLLLCLIWVYIVNV